MRLVISLATRGRPHQLLNTITRSVANWSEPNTVMMVGVDADDQATIDALNVAGIPDWHGDLASLPARGPFMDILAREDTIAEKWNRALDVPAELYLVAADDDPYVTPGYDRKLLEAASRFPDGIGMVYGHMANASFSGVVAPTRGLVDKLGHIFPEFFPYWFVDHWTDDIARLIGRIAFADVRTDQTAVGKTQELREPAWWATFFDAGYLVRRKIARAIIDGDDFQEPEWRKEILRSHYPLIEFRSRWINDNVRAQNNALESWSGLSRQDARYQRVRGKAVELLPQWLADMEPAEAKLFRDRLIPPTEVVSMRRAFA